jgi:hypothetical protein
MVSARAIAATVAILLAPGPARAQADRNDLDEEFPTEEPEEPVEPAEPEHATLPWHGTTFSFDQSVTTQTVGLGSDYQSYDPTYEWWFALKPRYWLYESKVESVSVSAWANLYLELTNSDTTTRKHEPLLGPTVLLATYGRTLRDVGDVKTQVSVSPRLTFPTDKGAYASGQLLGLGTTVSMSQTAPFSRAKDGPRGDAALTLAYGHTFTRAMSPVSSDLHVLRQDASGRTFVSDVLRGTMNPAHALTASVGGGVRVVPRLNVSASYVMAWTWLYAPPDASVCSATGGCIVSDHVDAPSRTRVSTWLLLSVDVELLDEMSISIGYYNQANQLGPDGRRRNVLWSPDARFFLTLTANLDAIYQRAFGRGSRE